MYYVYFIYSSFLEKFYIGQTSNLEVRIEQHNLGLSKWTKKGIPWVLVHTIKCENRAEAIRLERKIKKRGAKRYLEDHKIEYSFITSD